MCVVYYYKFFNLILILILTLIRLRINKINEKRGDNLELKKF